MITKSAFIEKIQSLPATIPSITQKATYTDFYLENNFLFFTRVNTGQKWKLDLDQLYDVYKNNSYINTTIVKRETGGRVNAPSVAVLLAINCIDKLGNRIL